MCELTSEELGKLLHLSHTRPRREQERYLEFLGRLGTAKELEQAITLAKNDVEAVEMAEQFDCDWRKRECPNTKGVNKEISQAVRWFTHSVMAGDFGPDDSRDGRSAVFLKNPHVVARALEIFLENLLIDRQGKVLNHDAAESRAAEYIQDQCP
jgi:hypothetical protein